MDSRGRRTEKRSPPILSLGSHRVRPVRAACFTRHRLWSMIWLGFDHVDDCGVLFCVVSFVVLVVICFFFFVLRGFVYAGFVT